MTEIRVPKALTEKFNDLLREQTDLTVRLAEVAKAMDALAYSISIIDPEWERPLKAKGRLKPSRLPRGTVANDCLQLLRQEGSMWTPELVARIAERRRLKFETRKAEMDFASAVAMALRRYERQGVLQVVEKEPRTQALRWEMCVDEQGQMEVRPSPKLAA